MTTFGELTFGELSGHQIPMKYCSILHYLNIVPVVYSKITCTSGSFCSLGRRQCLHLSRTETTLLISTMQLNCRYRQIALSISTIRVADNCNSKCLYRQKVLNDDSAYHIGKLVSALQVQNLPSPFGTKTAALASDFTVHNRNDVQIMKYITTMFRRNLVSCRLAEYQFTECHFGEGHFAKCHFAKDQFAECCHFAIARGPRAATLLTSVGG